MQLSFNRFIDSSDFFLFNLPRSILHPELSTKNNKHINTTIIKYPCPIFYHPFARILMYEFIFEIENVRIIWRHFHFINLIWFYFIILYMLLVNCSMWFDACICSYPSRWWLLRLSINYMQIMGRVKKTNKYC